MKVAAVDIGSNALRMAAAEFTGAGRHRRKLGYERVPVRLGHSAFLTGRLTEENMDVAAGALARFRRQLEKLGLPRVRVVATSAVRESENGPALVARVLEESGLRIETISGDEEARLVWVAVRDRLPFQGRRVLADLGGGSLEVSLATETGIEWSESHPIGTVRLLEDPHTSWGSDGSASRRVRELTSRVRVPVLEPGGPAGLIATGGNIEALAKLAEAPRDGNGVARLPVEELDALNRRLAKLSYHQRMEQLGLRADRADVIIPAGLVYQRVAELAGAAEVVVPGVGVIDGVLRDLAVRTGEEPGSGVG